MNRKMSHNQNSPQLLTGFIFDDIGDRLSPSQTTKAGKLYFYYISHRLMQKKCHNNEGWRISSQNLDKRVIGSITKFLRNPSKVLSMINLTTPSPPAALLVNWKQCQFRGSCQTKGN
jgi:hypothetical protein